MIRIQVLVLPTTARPAPCSERPIPIMRWNEVFKTERTHSHGVSGEQVSETAHRRPFRRLPFAAVRA
jgi:hypothetical protein